MISGATLKKALLSGANNIINNKKHVDDLNIFPVPDGDTGTNMSMTITAAAKELEKLPEEVTVSRVSAVTASAMLRGARGNSGVILSLLFRGIAKGLAEKEAATGLDLVSALQLGVESAYQAVSKPIEGTILTVARIAAQTATTAAEVNNDAVYVWSCACAGAANALEQTPNLLPVLKKAGVVDAGGKGLCLIFDGMLRVLKDDEMIARTPTKEEKEEETAEFFRNAAAEFDEVINFTYCTEFIVGRDPNCDKDPADLRAYLLTIGDCVVVVDDEEIIKTHVHTEQPGNVLQKALEYGQLLTVKIENMREQHKSLAKVEEEQPASPTEETALPERTEPTEEFGFVSVAAGDGIQNLFRDLGCTRIVSGGQTMNPSTEDICAAIFATPAKVVYVLPNNKNIIMAAQQTVELVSDRRVVIIPSKTIPQGISAMLAFDESTAVEENEEVMTQALSTVDTGLVTFAARDSEYGGQKIKADDILGLVNGKLSIVEKDITRAAVKVTKSLIKRDTATVTVFYGADMTRQQAEELQAQLVSKLSDEIEVTLVDGGQPVYYCIISVE